MTEMYPAHVTEVANPKEDLLRSLESINWKNQVKTESTVFIKPNFTFPYLQTRDYYIARIAKEPVGNTKRSSG